MISLRSNAVCLIGFATLIGLAGCQDRSQKFIPSPATAENALIASLKAWQRGVPSGPVPDSKPLIHVTDNTRKPGQLLTSFKMLGEKPSSHGRTYIVELSLDMPTEHIKAEYIIVGIDPLWVFCREDYELLMHWDHHMPKSASPTDEPLKP